MADSEYDPVKHVLARVAAGQAVNAEDAMKAAASAGFTEEELRAALSAPQPVVQWVSASTAQGHEPIEVPESKVLGEEAAGKDLEESTVYEEDNTFGKRSNDPATNPLATGGEPFEDTSHVGYSGQVIDAASYAPEDDDKSSKKKANA